MDNSSKKIGVFGHYGNQNLGDEAIITAVIQNIKQREPDATIYGFSINPADTGKRYNIPAYPIRNTSNIKYRLNKKQQDTANRPSFSNAFQLEVTNPVHWFVKAKSILERFRVMISLLKVVRRFLRLPLQLIREFKFLRMSYNTLKGIDLLLISGSNQFLDNFGGTWGYPYTLLKWSVLAKLVGAKLAFVGVGAGPLKAMLSKILVRMSLLFSDYTSFRDQASKQLIETTGFCNKGSVFPDLAYSLSTNNHSPDGSDSKVNGELPTIGINPMPMYDSRYWCLPNVNKYHDYVCKLASFASILLYEGYPIFFFNTMLRDEDVIEDVLGKLDQDVRDKLNPHELVRSNRSVPELMDTLAHGDIIVATRFHGTVLSLLAGRPVLAICYYRKSTDLMKDMGQEDYALELDSFEVADLLKRFKTLVTNCSFEKKKIQRKNKEYRAALKEQYDAVFRLLTLNK